MGKTDMFAGTFATLRGVLEPYAAQMIVQVDTPTDYQLCSRTLTDRIGRPLSVAAVQIKQNYVTFHLMPVYGSPELQKAISPALRKRMQGKACFNFTVIERSHVRELAGLTKRGIKGFQKSPSPW